MKHLWYLVAAYSSVWIVLGVYIFRLFIQNKHLAKQVERLEEAVQVLESRNENQDLSSRPTLRK